MFWFPQLTLYPRGMWGRLARSETIQGVERKPSDERQAAAMNTTTSLDRNQILDLCKLIHTSQSGNLSGSRIPCPRVVPLYPGHFVNAQTQSHPRVTGRHPHGLPSHHLESGGCLHPFDRRPPSSMDTSGGGPRPRPPIHHRRHPWRPAGHGATVPNCTQANTTPRG